MEYRSQLHKSLSEGKFTVTAEIGPPKGADPLIIYKKASILKGYADAFNITDNQTGVVRLSSMAGCIILIHNGIEPIMQLTCRDRNRIALQSDVLGASALGIRNILCLTGDHQSFGNHPNAKGVYDIDSIQLIKILKELRENGKFQSGDEIRHGKPDIYIGAAANPFAEPLEYRVDRLGKKIDAGVDFIQTQSVFNLDRFAQWMDEIREQGLDKRVKILAGITPLKSVKMTERMKFHVPGVDIPENIVLRMKKAKNPELEGKNIALELIRDIRKNKGFHGLHITALFWENIIPDLVKEANLLNKN